jgi:hypothetical protein
MLIIVSFSKMEIQWVYSNGKNSLMSFDIANCATWTLGTTDVEKLKVK